MVEIADIKDGENQQTWLLDRPEAEALAFSRAIASRIALRVFPMEWRWVQQEDFAPEVDLTGLTALPFLRCNLTALVAGTRPTGAIRQAAAASIADTVSFILLSLTHAAYAAAHAATTTNATIAARDAAHAADINAGIDDDAYAYIDADLILFWSALRADCAALAAGETAETLAQRPLWPEGENPLQADWDAAKQAVQPKAPAPWAFWVDWYEAVLAGKPQNRDMLEEIALLPDDDWQQGAAHMAAMIAQIKKRHEEDMRAVTSQQALARNANVVAAQLEALRVLIADEIERIRGANSISDQDRALIDARIDKLQAILNAVCAMIEALADSDATNALMVIEEKLPQVIEGADQLGGEAPEISAPIITMAATVDYMTKRGTPAYVASGFAVVDLVFKPIAKWLKRDKRKER